MANVALRRFSLWFSIYVLIALLSLNVGLYSAYFSTSTMWRGEHPDFVFLFRLTDPSFPLWGLALSFFSAILGWVPFLICLRKMENVFLKLVLSVLSVFFVICVFLDFCAVFLDLGFFLYRFDGNCLCCDFCPRNFA